MRAARPALALVLAFLVIGTTLAGCRLAGSAPTSVASVAPSASELPGEVAGEPPTSPPGPEAPAECGFLPGAALEFAGRSTYAALGVGDAAGASSDPMSDDPADIYITRDTYNQGQLHGRLVCAIFVGANQWFVEITVHPQDWGRFTPVPEPGEPTNGLSETEAAEAARAGLPEPHEWAIQIWDAGPIGDFYPEWKEHDWGRGISADHWVWTAEAVRGDRGVSLFIDYVDGTVLGTIEFILDECDPRSPEYESSDCPDL
jgi:hypothetical protein